MAKPKGATLTRLFAVSDAERKAFWQELEGKRGNQDLAAAIPSEGVPVSGIPKPTSAAALDTTGTPVSGIPVSVFQKHLAGPEPGVPVSGVPEADAAFQLRSTAPGRKIREAVKVQDGHSLGEQAVYAALWSAAHPQGEDCRRLTIGYRTLSDICGLTVNNCKANLQSLVRKLAIEPIAGHTSTLGTTYLIHSYPAILRRRRQSGMTHVIKTKGVVFVNVETGVPVTSTPELRHGIPATGVPDTGRGTPEPNLSGIPLSATPIRNKEIIEGKAKSEEHPSSSSFPLVVTAARDFGVTLDDDAARRIVLRSQTFDESASETEIAYFVRAKAAQLRNSRNVENLVGLLIKAVPQYFTPPATELTSLRQEITQKTEWQARQSREEAEASKQAASAILADPEASEAEREWARGVLSEPTGKEAS